MPAITTKHIVAAAMICVFAALLSVPSVSAQAENWWNLSFTRRRSLTVSGTHPDNFQIAVHITYDSDMRTDFADLRFVEDGGVLSYWIENISTGNYADVWVRRIGTGPSNTMYVYYGNSNAASESNENTTFLIYDSFNSSTGIDTSKWATAAANGSVSLDSNCLKLSVNSAGTGTFATLYSLDNFLTPIRIEALVSSISGPVYASAGQGSTTNYTGGQGWLWNGYLYRCIPGTGGQNYMYRVQSSGVTQIANTTSSPPASGEEEFFWKTNYQYGELGNSGIADTSDSVVSLPDRAHVYLNTMGGSGGGYVLYDWVRARRYVDAPEPTVSIGSEEQKATQVIIDNVAVYTTYTPWSTIDRDRDWDNNVHVAIQIRADVKYENTSSGAVVASENVFFAFFSADNTLMDNKRSTHVIFLDSNRRRVKATYTATDNAISDAKLGYWHVIVRANDNLGSNTFKQENNLFIVDDYTGIQTIENLPQHRIRSRTEVKSVSGLAPLITDNRQAYVKDNVAGTFQTLWTDNRVENTFATLQPGTTYAYFRAGLATGIQLDGIGEVDTHGIPNIVATCIYISPSENTIDRDQDVSGFDTSPVLQATITAYVQDSDGAGDISGARLVLYDSADTVRENIEMSENGTLDENTKIYVASYNPPDNLPDNVLGPWDVSIVARDNYGSSSLENDNLFIVDDLRVVAIEIINPTFPALGPVYNSPILVVGHVRNWLEENLLDNSWVVDSKEGTFVADNDGSVSYVILHSHSGDNSAVTFYAWRSPLDGAGENIYTVSENRYFIIQIRWENTYALVNQSLFPARGTVFQLFYTDNTTSELIAPDENPDAVITEKAVRSAMIWDANFSYFRNVLPDENGGTIEFFIVEDPSLLTYYTFMLEDPSGMYSPPVGRLYIYSYYLENRENINSDYWTVSGSVPAYLIQNKKYTLVVANQTSSRDVGKIYADADQTKLVRVSGIPSPAPLITDVVAWSAYRVSGSVVRTVYCDNSGGTDEADVTFMGENGENLYYVRPITPDNFVVSWINANAGESYIVRLHINHNLFGTLDYTGVIGADISAWRPQLASENVSITGMFNMPVSFAALGSLVAIICIALIFDIKRVGIGMLAISFSIAFFWVMGWLPLDWYTVALIFIVSLLFVIAEGRRK